MLILSIRKNTCFFLLFSQTATVESFDLDGWWLNHRQDFPKLFQLHLQTSCIPATSSSAEREFSATGSIITEKRSRTAPDTVNNIMILRHDKKRKIEISK